MDIQRCVVFPFYQLKQFCSNARFVRSTGGTDANFLTKMWNEI